MEQICNIFIKKEITYSILTFLIFEVEIQSIFLDQILMTEIIRRESKHGNSKRNIMKELCKRFVSLKIKL